MDGNNKFDNLSEDELRDMIERKREIESMSRDEMVAELLSANLPDTGDKESIDGISIHKNSRLAALAVGPDEIIQAEFRALPIWVWVITAIFAILMLSYIIPTIFGEGFSF